MAKNIFRLALLLILGLVAIPSTGLARANELNYFQTEKTELNGQRALRIELGMSRDKLKYSAHIDAASQSLVIDLEETTPGELKKLIRLDGEAAQSLSLRETQRNHTQVKISLTYVPTDSEYKIYTLPAERHPQKPHRLVIEIAKPSGSRAAPLGEGVKGRTIIIDPGHGGSDSGAIGPNGLTEKEATLAVSLKLRDILKSAGAKVAMTRETDRDVYAPGSDDRLELQARVNVGNRTPNLDIFVSIHCNAFSSPTANGTETYYCAGSPRGELLASLIDEELIAAGGLNDRGVKSANFYVLRHTAVPATLIELAFITNYREEALLGDDAFQSKMATAIATGIERYFNTY